MSAYFQTPARPLLCAQANDDLRGVDRALLRAGQLGEIADPGNAQFLDLFRWDPDETAADDDLDYLQLADAGSGRWVRCGGEDVAGGYVRRKADGTIDGAGGSPDFSQRVLHVNEGGAAPSAPNLYGLSVTFTAGAARLGFFYDPANSEFAVGEDTLGTDATLAAYHPLRVLRATADYFGAPTGGASAGRVRLAVDDEVRARVGADQRRLLAALTGDTLAFGDTDAATTTLDAKTTLSATSRLGGVKLRAATDVRFTDPSDLNEVLRADVSSGNVYVKGVLDCLSAGALSLGGDGKATSVAVNGLRVTGLLAGNASGHAVEYAQMNAAIAGAAFVPTSRQVLAGTNLSGGGALSADVTLNLSAALAGITSIDNSGGAMTVGANTTGMTYSKSGTTFALLGLLTVAGLATFSDELHVARSITTTNVTGLVVEPNAAADVSNTVRYSPDLVLGARARVGVTNRTVLWRAFQLPTTGGNTALKVQRDLGAGAGYADFFSLTTASPGNVVSGALCGRFLVDNSSGGFLFDTGATGSGMSLDGSFGLLLNSVSGSASMVLKCSSTAADTEVIRFWAGGETKTPLERVMTLGDGTSFAEISRWTGDGVYEARAFHDDATVHTDAAGGGFTAVLHTLHRVDLSGTGNVVPSIPAASAANLGKEILFVQTVAGVDSLVLTPASGSIEGAATLTVVGVAVAPFRSVRIVSCGNAGGSPGWKVVALV